MIDSGIVIIGTGNVGSALALRLHHIGQQIRAVYNRTPHKAHALAARLSTQVAPAIDALPRDAGLYLLAVNDDAIESAAQQLSRLLPQTAIVAHTSGATPLEAVARHFRRAAIFYPLQSFAPERQPRWEQIPICLSANQAATLDALRPLAARAGGQVYVLDDRQRQQLHVAAVFANNFTNYCYHVAERLLASQHLPFEMLHPLIRETAARLSHAPPAQLQTGPAIRGDRQTIARHIEVLAPHPEWQALYEHLTRLISELRSERAS